jgi:hypothetical protein
MSALLLEVHGFGAAEAKSGIVQASEPQLATVPIGGVVINDT